MIIGLPALKVLTKRLKQAPELKKEYVYLITELGGIHICSEVHNSEFILYGSLEDAIRYNVSIVDWKAVAKDKEVATIFRKKIGERWMYNNGTDIKQLK